MFNSKIQAVISKIKKDCLDGTIMRIEHSPDLELLFNLLDEDRYKLYDQLETNLPWERRQLLKLELQELEDLHSSLTSFVDPLADDFPRRRY